MVGITGMDSDEIRRGYLERKLIIFWDPRIHIHYAEFKIQFSFAGNTHTQNALDLLSRW